MPGRQTQVAAHIAEFLNSKPEEYRASTLPSQTFPKLPKSLSFYDDHVDSQLALKTVALSSDLKDQLSANIQRRQEFCQKQSLGLPSTLDDSFPTSEVLSQDTNFSICPTAARLSKEYESRIFQHCGVVASTLYFAPALSEWKSVFSYEDITSSQNYPFITDCYGITVDSSSNSWGAWHFLPQETKDLITRAKSHCSAAAILQFFDDSPIAERLLKDMETVDPSSLQPLPQHQSGSVALWSDQTDISTYGDMVNSTIVNDLISSSNARQHTANDESSEPGRPVKGKRRKRRMDLPAITILAPNRLNTKSISAADLVPAVLRRAWTRAVAANSSFIIFHGGRFERIGVRDRENQTLYLSGLIEVQKQSNPGYYAIHTGLFLAVLQDVLTRTSENWQQSARQKSLQITSGHGRRSRSSMVRDLRARSIALLAMQYDGLKTSRPTAFTRLEAGTSHIAPKEVSFQPTQYFLVTLVSEIARGGVGIVHDAILDFSVSKGSMHRTRAIVKLAFTTKQCRRLRKEMVIYDHLFSAEVKGVPCVYGVFKHPDSGMLAMIMDHVGESLITRYQGVYDHTMDSAVLSPLRNQFTRILTDIHDAGVLHRDLRPENLTLDSKGNGYIIDFDRARQSPTQAQKETEVVYLDEILSGERDPGFLTSSKAQTSSASRAADLDITPRASPVDDGHSGEDED